VQTAEQLPQRVRVARRLRRATPPRQAREQRVLPTFRDDEGPPVGSRQRRRDRPIEPSQMPKDRVLICDLIVPSKGVVAPQDEGVADEPVLVVAAPARAPPPQAVERERPARGRQAPVLDHARTLDGFVGVDVRGHAPDRSRRAPNPLPHRPARRTYDHWPRRSGVPFGARLPRAASERQRRARDGEWCSNGTEVSGSSTCRMP
jgi:hypothetical protein